MNNNIVQAVLGRAVVFVVLIFLLFLNKRIFRHLQKNQQTIHLRFFEKVIRVLLIIVAVLLMFYGIEGTQRLWTMAFGSTVLIGGVLGLAGKDILKDILAGLMISIYKPFELGDRVLLKDIEKPSTVDDITIRHTVLKTMDNVKYIVPNSVMNEEIVTNTSFRQKLRATFLQFGISYKADIRLAIHIIRETIKNSPYTCPNNPANKDLDGYGDVYMIKIDPSALVLETTIWTEPETDNFLACSEVRIAVIGNLAKAGIEIPYQHVDLKMEDGGQLYLGKMDAIKQDGVKSEEKKPESPSDSMMGRRNSTIKMSRVYLRESPAKIKAEAEKFCRFFQLNPKQTNTLLLLTEELTEMTKSILQNDSSYFWIKGNRSKVRLMVQTTMRLDSAQRKNLMDMSTVENTSNLPGFFRVIKDVIDHHLNSKERYVWSMKKDNTNKKLLEVDLNKKIITSLSDDIEISIQNDKVRIIVYKDLRNLEK
ncbi:MAG: mechanosensitive ion channel family protein [Lachnospiraceae bacterium]|nr:mechanosensitive ion channel family protein [Lachnospiraceae bacterium]